MMELGLLGFTEPRMYPKGDSRAMIGTQSPAGFWQNVCDSIASSSLGKESSGGEVNGLCSQQTRDD